MSRRSLNHDMETHKSTHFVLMYEDIPHGSCQKDPDSRWALPECASLLATQFVVLGTWVFDNASLRPISHQVRIPVLCPPLLGVVALDMVRVYDYMFRVELCCKCRSYGFSVAALVARSWHCVWRGFPWFSWGAIVLVAAFWRAVLWWIGRGTRHIHCPLFFILGLVFFVYRSFPCAFLALS